MIVLNVNCQHGHRFEGWFASRDVFDAQAADGLISCPQCASTTIVALPSGPRIRRQTDAAVHAVQDGNGPARSRTLADTAVGPASNPDAAASLFSALAAMARKAENVGDRFPAEARRIHYEEAPARTIRGIANLEETRKLIEEGIVVLPALVPPESETH